VSAPPPDPRALPLAVVVGQDPEGVAAVARAAEAAGGRAAVFVGDPAKLDDRTALLELITELFP
jgi:hypothetical protein